MYFCIENKNNVYTSKLSLKVIKKFFSTPIQKFDFTVVRLRYTKKWNLINRFPFISRSTLALTCLTSEASGNSASHSKAAKALVLIFVFLHVDVLQAMLME